MDFGFNNVEDELLRMSKFDLFRIYKTLFESLIDSGYFIENLEVKKLIEQNAFHEFCNLINSYKIEKNKIRLKIIKKKLKQSKKGAFSSKKSLKTKKSDNNESLESIPEEKDDKDKINKKKKKKKGKKKNTILNVISNSSDNKGDNDDKQDEKEEKKVNEVNEVNILGLKSSAFNGGKKMPIIYYDENMSCFETCLTFFAYNDFETVLILFSNTPGLKKEAIEIQLIPYLEKLTKTRKITRIQILCHEDPTSAAGDSLLILEEKYKVRIRLFSDLLVNISKHFLVSKHRKLNAQQKKNWIDLYDPDQNRMEHFPKIRIDDPMVIYHDFQPGDIIELSREGTAVTYRIVT